MDTQPGPPPSYSPSPGTVIAASSYDDKVRLTALESQSYERAAYTSDRLHPHRAKKIAAAVGLVFVLAFCLTVAFIFKHSSEANIEPASQSASQIPTDCNDLKDLTFGLRTRIRNKFRRMRDKLMWRVGPHSLLISGVVGVVSLVLIVTLIAFLSIKREAKQDLAEESWLDSADAAEKVTKSEVGVEVADKNITEMVLSVQPKRIVLRLWHVVVGVVVVVGAILVGWYAFFGKASLRHSSAIATEVIVKEPSIPDTTIAIKDPLSTSGELRQHLMSLQDYRDQDLVLFVNHRILSSNEPIPEETVYALPAGPIFKVFVGEETYFLKLEQVLDKILDKIDDLYYDPDYVHKIDNLDLDKLQILETHYAVYATRSDCFENMQDLAGNSRGGAFE